MMENVSGLASYYLFGEMIAAIKKMPIKRLPIFNPPQC